MGAGKTTIGQKLAKQLNYTFLDTDQEIEKNKKQTITTIITTQGLQTFRQYENELCQTLPNLTHHVIATGGGLPIEPRNQKYLLKTGKIFYLNTPFNIIWDRIKQETHRPLVVKESKKELLNRYLSRHPIYQKLSSNDTLAP